jgi:hypothetical protein
MARSKETGSEIFGAGKAGVRKRVGKEGQGLNCGPASVSVLLNDQFKSDMERGVRERESLVVSGALVLSRAGGECS